MDVHKIDPESQWGQEPDQGLTTTNPNGAEQQKATDGVDQNERGIIVLTEKLIGQIVPAVQLQEIGARQLNQEHTGPNEQKCPHGMPDGVLPDIGGQNVDERKPV